MLSSRTSVLPTQDNIDHVLLNLILRTMRSDRPTRDRILLAMLADEVSNEKHGVTKLARTLSLSKGAVGDQLNTLKNENPPLVKSEKRGLWVLLEAGREYAHSCLPRTAPHANREAQESGIPFRGLIGAGEPTPRIDATLDYFSFPVLDSDEYFIMEVRGDSMLNEHICDGDMVILRNVSGWDGWNNIASGNIIAAAVPEGANVHLPDWLDRLIQSIEAGDIVSDIPLEAVTLKKLDNRMRTLIGRYGAIRTQFQPVGVLVQVYRQYSRGARYRGIS